MTAFREIQERFESARNSILERKARKELLESQIAEIEKDIQRLGEEIDISRKAVLLIGEAADSLVKNVSEVFESIVTPVLQHILGEGYSFKVEWSRGSSQNPSADFLVKTPYIQGTEAFINPRYKGGGVRDVVGFALRFSFLCLMNNKGVVVLDEAFSQLDQDRLPCMAQTIKYIQKRMGHQILFITHDQDYIDHADSVVKVEYKNGKSYVTKVS